MDMTLRAMVFMTLAKTTSQETVNRLIERLTTTDDKEQILAFMKSFIRTLLETDNPTEQL